MPINTLKINRSFVARVGEDAEDEHIVRTIVDLASAISLDVVADRVEVSEQATRLRALGCERAQGYYLSKPLPGGAVDALLAKQLADD